MKNGLIALFLGLTAGSAVMYGVTVEETLAQIQAAPSAQKRQLINDLKRQLAGMDTQSRDAAIARLAQEHRAPISADLLMQQQRAATYSWYEQEKSAQQTSVSNHAKHPSASPGLGSALGGQKSGGQKPVQSVAGTPSANRLGNTSGVNMPSNVQNNPSVPKLSNGKTPQTNNVFSAIGK